mgnify:CR=1 FL=1|jgi:hypothetical protein
MDHVYEIDLDISQHHLLALNDALRMFTIQVVVQFLFVLRNDSIEYFSQIFIENTLFIILGVFSYWFIFDYLIRFKSTRDKDERLENYFQNNYIKNTTS